MSIAIQVQDLSKAYQIGQIGTGTISRDLERWWTTTVRGKEDPFLKIGETNDRSTKGKSDIVWSLKDINFEIQQGDAVGIIGRNGAGKSTLLKLLSEVTSPTTGKINIKGRVASLLEVGTGFHPELTGRENIFLNGAILGMRKKEIQRKLDQIIDFSGVERYVDTPVKRYSSGMYVRLAFAVAAHLESEILIVDEVLAVGDAEFQKKCLGKMNEVSKGEGRTVLFVSHYMGMISQLCNKAIILKNGTVFDSGKAQDMVAVYSLNTTTNNSVYEVDQSIANIKHNYIKQIATINESSEITSDFLFNTSILIKIEFLVRDSIPNLQIGIGVNDKLQTRIFTVLRSINDFINKDGIYNGILEIPKSLLAPNIYNLTVALWTNGGKVYDLAENICQIKIHDSGGTGLSLFEGIDYGNIIITPKWF